MPVVSIRFSDEPLHRRLKETARKGNVAVSSLAERLIDEGLRMQTHPLVAFRDGPSGRRATLMGGPDIADVVRAIVGGDVPVEERRGRAAELLGLIGGQVDAAMAYYADFTDEIDTEISRRMAFADQAETAWRRRHELLGS